MQTPQNRPADTRFGGYASRDAGATRADIGYVLLPVRRRNGNAAPQVAGSCKAHPDSVRPHAYDRRKPLTRRVTIQALSVLNSRDENDMTLRDRVNTALKQAMRDKDASRLATLRLINAAIKDQEIAARAGGDDDDAGVGDAEVLAILSKMTKQRQESVRAYEEGGRIDLAERERAEVAVIEEFLPRQLNEAEVTDAVDKAIAETGATSIRDMGKVMGVLKQHYTGQIDFGAVGPRVKDRLCQGA